MCVMDKGLNSQTDRINQVEYWMIRLLLDKYVEKYST